MATTVRYYDPEALAVRRRSRRRRELCKRVALHALLIVLLFFMLYPVIWMALSSLRPEDEIFANLGLIPTNWTVENYITGWHLFGDKTFGDFFINSFVLCALAIC